MERYTFVRKVYCLYDLPCNAMLCYVIRYDAMLCDAIAMLCYAMLCYAMLCYACVFCALLRLFRRQGSYRSIDGEATPFFPRQICPSCVEEKTATDGHFYSRLLLLLMVMLMLMLLVVVLVVLVVMVLLVVINCRRLSASCGRRKN